MQITEPGSEPLSQIDFFELKILQTLLPVQILNNKYRKDLRKQYDIADEFEEDLMNNKLYGLLTDG